MRGDLLLGAVSRKWSGCGQTLIQHTRQRIDVRAGIDLAGSHPLRGHVVPAADNAASAGQSGLVGTAGDPEIDQVGEVVLVEQDVGRLDVAVYQTDFVRGVKRFGYLLDDADGSCRF